GNLQATDLMVAGMGAATVSTPSTSSATVATFPINVTTAVIATDTLTANLPVTITGCDTPVTVTVTVLDSAGTGTVVPTTMLTTSAALGMGMIGDAVADLAECFDAFQPSITADNTNLGTATNAGQDSQLSLASNFMQFLVDAMAPMAGLNTSPPDTATLASLSRVDIPAPAPADGSTAVGDGLFNGNAANDPPVAADVTSVTFTLTLGSTAGLGTPTLTAGDLAMATGVASMTDPTVFTFTAAGSGAFGQDSFIQIPTATMAATISAQQPTVTNAAIDLAAGFVDQSVTVVGSGSDDLQLQGQAAGPFDWVPDATFAVNTVFRGTGFGATAPEAAVTISNSSLGVNGQFPITLPAPQNGQIILNAQLIQDAVGQPFGIGDVTITTFSGTAVDWDRLYATNGVISAHGDTFNQD
ncbi:MAG: hypothetical protein AAFU66_04635, partial [Pseudomonadota bacterium]